MMVGNILDMTIAIIEVSLSEINKNGFRPGSPSSLEIDSNPRQHRSYPPYLVGREGIIVQEQVSQTRNIDHLLGECFELDPP